MNTLIFNDNAGTTHIVNIEHISNVVFHPASLNNPLRLTMHFNHHHVVTAQINEETMNHILSSLEKK